MGGGLRKIALAALGALCCAALPLGAFTGELKRLSIDDFKKLRADSWKATGKNIIIQGNVFMPFGPYEIHADQVIVNLESKDFEAVGNVRFYRWQKGKLPVSIEKLSDLEKRPNTFVHSVSSNVSPWGEVEYTAEVSYQSDRITADRVAGNIQTSFFRFENLSIHYTTFVCRAESAERRSNGVIVLKNGEVSACGYLESDNAHYSIAASEIKLTPHEANFYELKYADFDLGDRSVLLLNGMVKIYGVPLLWLPVFYKPKDESPGICGIQFGSDSDWGYYINLYRRFSFSDAPALNAKVLLDWYEKRGFGYGVEGQLRTNESVTDVFFYSIYDKNQFASEDYDKYRLKIPHYRFDFRVSNITHITPRLDFRGAFEYQSDLYFRRDFFRARYDKDPAPATFAALEQQFDHFSASIYARFRVNDFYSTVEKLPEIRLDAQRQEILNTGIYYQGDFSAAYMRMKWIDFDKAPGLNFRKTPTDLDIEMSKQWSKLKDYDTFRLDTTHFLYYPIATRYFTLVPRAGFKMTAYSHSSRHSVSSDELITMFVAANPQGNGQQKFQGYDRKGGSRLRFAMEFGFELSTKIHNTWNNVRSNFFRIDGIRHVMQPYVNYTFIPEPTEKREHLYYFDDIDRITRQNFVRFGLINRLQTRSGNGIETFFRMENYWDIHMEWADGMSQLGNLGTIISMRILKGLTINTKLLIDVSNDGNIPDTIRNGRNVGRVGLAQKWLNLWNFNINYNPAKDWNFSFGYNYIRPYGIRSAYSMGSTLTMIDAASSFERYINSTEESFYFGVTAPLTPDHRTLGIFKLSYDVPKGSIDEVNFALIRQFHCWQLIATVGFDRNYKEHKPMWDVNYSISANLTGLDPKTNSVQNSVLRSTPGLANGVKF